MPEQIVVQCPSCSQKYRVKQSALGHRARCAKCKIEFVVGSKAACDEDTILSWITESDPASESVMGSTGLFHPSELQARATTARATQPAARTAAKPGAVPATVSAVATAAPSAATSGSTAAVRLAGIDNAGAHFEFPASALTREDLRDSFPRKCAGCGARHGLSVHLVYWPDRMRSHEAVHWKDYQNGNVGEWDHFSHLADKTWLKRLPPPRHCSPPFDTPFPFLVCRQCRATHEVRGRVSVRGTMECCDLEIRSLGAAVEFFRNNGGRHTPEYQRLIEERDIRHDRRNELSPDVRVRLSHWFSPFPGEEFVHYFPDAEFSAAEAGNAGVVLTVRRLVFKKFAAYRDYPLHQPCRMEVRPDGPRSIVQVSEEGHRPATFALDAADAHQLIMALGSLSCHWRIDR